MPRIVVYTLPECEDAVYHLGKLLDKLCSLKKTIGIFCSSDRTDYVDKKLWTFSTNAFVPHNVATGGSLDAEQPVLIANDVEFLENRKTLCVFDISGLQTIFKDISWQFDDIIIFSTEKNIVENVEQLSCGYAIEKYSFNKGKWVKM